MTNIAKLTRKYVRRFPNFEEISAISQLFAENESAIWLMNKHFPSKNLQSGFLGNFKQVIIIIQNRITACNRVTIL